MGSVKWLTGQSVRHTQGAVGRGSRWRRCLLVGSAAGRGGGCLAERRPGVYRLVGRVAAKARRGKFGLVSSAGPRSAYPVARGAQLSQSQRRLGTIAGAAQGEN